MPVRDLRRRLVLPAVLLLLPLLWFGPRVVAAATSPVPAWARDLNCDGKVRIHEWYEGGLDHSFRRGTGDCWEVFSLKDGLPDILWCGTPPSCGRPSIPGRAG
jgi:hypothetical protein